MALTFMSRTQKLPLIAVLIAISFQGVFRHLAAVSNLEDPQALFDLMDMNNLVHRHFTNVCCRDSRMRCVIYSCVLKIRDSQEFFFKSTSQQLTLCFFVFRTCLERISATDI